MNTKHLTILICGISIALSSTTSFAGSRHQDAPILSAFKANGEQAEHRKAKKEKNYKQKHKNERKSPRHSLGSHSSNNRSGGNRSNKNSDHSSNQTYRKHKANNKWQNNRDQHRVNNYPGDKDRRHSNRQNDHRDRDNNRHNGWRNDRHNDRRNNKHQHAYKRKNNHRHRHFLARWYNTRYLAPMHINFNRIGYRTRVLPRTYVSISVGGLPFFYFSGMFYKRFGSDYMVVAAPIGAHVTTLPSGFIGFSIGEATFYYANNTYYSWDEPRQIYKVVQNPDGADEAIKNATNGRLIIYPKDNQNEELQSNDRYECHRWAVTQSDIDPTEEGAKFTNEENNNYRRAISACLIGRNYSVK